MTHYTHFTGDREQLPVGWGGLGQEKEPAPLAGFLMSRDHPADVNAAFPHSHSSFRQTKHLHIHVQDPLTPGHTITFNNSLWGIKRTSY